MFKNKKNKYILVGLIFIVITVLFTSGFGDKLIRVSEGEKGDIVLIEGNKKHKDDIVEKELDEKEKINDSKSETEVVQAQDDKKEDKNVNKDKIKEEPIPNSSSNTSGSGSNAMPNDKKTTNNPTQNAPKKENKPKEELKDTPVKEDVYTKKTITETETIPFSRINENDPTLDKGVKKVSVSGKNGVKTKYIEVSYKNGVETSRKVVDTKITTSPVNEVTLVGTKEKEACSLSKSSDQSVQLMNEINYSRCEAGLKPLVWNSELAEAAQIRSNELHELFSHDRPNGTPWHTVSSLAKGENVAMGYRDAEHAHSGFMNSAGHRANNLRESYGSVGISLTYNKNGQPYWAVLFGK